MSTIRIMELMALGFSLVLLHPANESKIRLLIPALLATVVAETMGWYYHTHLHRSNHLIYNISVPLVIIMLLLLLRANVVCRTDKRTVALLITAFLGFCLLDSLGNYLQIPLAQGLEKFCTYNYIVGTVALVISCCIFLLRLIESSGPVSLRGNSVFWVTLAIFILYVPKSVLYAVFEYFAYRKALNATFGTTFRFVNTILSIAFFSIISYACVCRLIFRK